MVQAEDLSKVALPKPPPLCMLRLLTVSPPAAVGPRALCSLDRKKLHHCFSLEEAPRKVARCLGLCHGNHVNTEKFFLLLIIAAAAPPMSPAFLVVSRIHQWGYFSVTEERRTSGERNDSICRNTQRCRDPLPWRMSAQ